jgi:gluconolactonase
MTSKHLLTLFFFLFFCCVNFFYAQSPIPSGAKLERIATGILQPEGPVWKDGTGLLFSDVKAAIIYQLSPADNSLSKYLAKSDSSNGLTFDKQGRLILTQMGKRRVSRQELNGTITPLATTYLGGRFNSPNDIVVKSDGAIFFTDPDFNIPVGGTQEIILNGAKIKGVYRISPKSGQVQLLDATFTLPNGICFSPDEKKLYVNESQQVKIYSFDVVNDSTITNKTLLYTLPQSGYADGMKVDSVGNIYCCGPLGVWIIPPSGNNYLDKISMPNSASASNCAWGDADKKTLYITSGSSVYKIRLAPTTSVNDKHGSIIPDNYKLFQNYPNPFNPSTVIGYQLPKAGFTSLKIYDLMGNEVKTLVNEFQPAGIYNFTLNLSKGSILNSQFSSGVYFYTLIAGNFTQTKKLILLK